MCAEAGKICVEVIVTLGQPLIHSGHDSGVASLLRWILHGQRERSLVALLGEDERRQLLTGCGAGRLYERLRAHDALGRGDLAEDPAQGHFRSVGASPYEAKGAAHAPILIAPHDRPACLVARESNA